MPISRHPNSNPGGQRSIIAIIAYTGNDVGSLGPRFGIQRPDFAETLMKLDQLADFLNDTTGKTANSIRTISMDLEQALVQDFSDVITTNDGKYLYTDPRIVDKESNYTTASYAVFAAREDALQRANNKGQNHIVGNFTSAEALAVMQREVSITNADSAKPILGSYGADPCIIVAAHNPSTNQTLLAHVDSLTDLKSLALNLNKISDNTPSLQIHLAGGDSSTCAQAAELIKMLEDMNIKIVSASICNDAGSKSLAIDSRTGEIFTFFYPNQLDEGNDSELRMMLVKANIQKSPLTLIFEDNPKINPQTKLTS